MTTVGCKDDNWSKVAFKSSVKIGEAFYIEHVDLIDEEDTWNKLSNTMIDILVHNFVDFKAELFGNFGFLGSINLAHERQEVVSSLWASVCNVQIMKSNILYNFLFLVDITFRDRYILFSLKIVLGGIGIRATDTLYCTASCLNVNYITNCDFLLLNVFVNAWIKLKLLLALGCLQADND